MIHRCLVDGPRLVGKRATIITIWTGDPGSSVRGVEVRRAPTSDDECPSSQAADWSFTIDYIPRGGKLVVDAAGRDVTITDEDGEGVGSLDRMTFDGIWEWIEADVGEQLCVEVDATDAETNPGTLVEVLTVLTEA